MGTHQVIPTPKLLESDMCWQCSPEVRWAWPRRNGLVYTVNMATSESRFEESGATSTLAPNHLPYARAHIYRLRIICKMTDNLDLISL